MASLKKIRRHLTSAMNDGKLVRVHRSPRYADSIDMFVVGIGAKWLLGVEAVDGGNFDGYRAVRVDDVRRVVRDTSAATRMARTRDTWPPERVHDIDLDRSKSVLRWFGERSALIGVMRERKRGALWVGALEDVKQGWLSLHEVDSRAEWHLSPLWYRVKSVTQISSGGRYLEGLETVMDEKPAIDPLRASS